jgi:pyruvate formate lyase activating enzyme
MSATNNRVNMGTEGYIHSVTTSSAAFGPGSRFVVFLSGCTLRCQYCDSPEMWNMPDGKKMHVGELLKQIGDYRVYLERTGGGVTASGGEPLGQPEFLTALFQGCKSLGLHTALDTSGFLGASATDALLDATDLVLLDIKSFDRDTYEGLTGGSLGPTRRFAERLAAMGKPVWLRYVLVKGLTDDLTSIASLASYACDLGNVECVEVLPFHKEGEVEWEVRGLPYTLRETPPPSRELVDRVRDLFSARGLKTV